MSALTDMHPAAITVLVAAVIAWGCVVVGNVRRLAKKLRGVGGALASVVLTGGILALIITLVVQA